jgi:hypothetical protein
VPADVPQPEETAGAAQQQHRADEHRCNTAGEQQHADEGVHRELTQKRQRVRDRNRGQGAAPPAAGSAGGRCIFHIGQQPVDENERAKRRGGEHREGHPPAGRVAERRRQWHSHNESGRRAAPYEREGTADIGPRYQPRDVADDQGEEQGVRDPADGSSGRDDGEHRRDGDQRVAERIAKQRCKQQRFAREAGGGQGQRDREGGDHHRVEAYQKAGEGIADGERAADIR